MSEHLPTCDFISFNTFAKAHDMEPPEDREWGDQVGIMRCDPDCPSLQRAIELGKTLTTKLGWNVAAPSVGQGDTDGN